MTDLVDLARDLRDKGMSLAARSQDAISPKWSERAYAAIVRLAERQPTVHIDDFLRDFPERPAVHQASGQPWRRAAQKGVIKHSGSVRPCLLDPKKHLHQSPVYQSLIYRGAP